MGRDSDDPRSLGEVGRCGVAIDSLADMETLFSDIDLEAITTSMTISGPAPMLFAMYIAAAKKQGADVSKLGGTIQADILKEYIAQKEWLFRPSPSQADGRHDALLRRERSEVPPLSVPLSHPRGSARRQYRS